MLACISCGLGFPLLIGTAGVFGGWAAVGVILRPYRFAERMPSVWGVPRFHISDFVSLFLLMMWPAFFMRIGRDSQDIKRVLFIGLIFAVCVLFLWLRGLWILQQCNVTAFFKRTLFLAALVPGVIILSFVIGMWGAVMIAGLLGGDPEFVFVATAYYGVVGGLLFVAVRYGLDSVFGIPSGRHLPPRPAGIDGNITPANVFHRNARHDGT